MIETERLLLRPFIAGDAAELYEISKDEEVGLGAGWKPHESPEETKALLKEVFLDQEDVFAIIRKDDGRLIGSIGLVADHLRKNEEARMLGYALGMDFWGMGYATEATKAMLFYGFLKKNYSLISVTHYTFNRKSEQVILKSGFQKEGVLRQGEIRFDGAMLDLACYSLDKSAFLAQKKMI